MRLARAARIKGEGVAGLLVIVLLILGGIVWYLFWSRNEAEKEARNFAAEITRRVAIGYDEKFLHVRLSPPAQIQYLQSWRDRLMERLRELGVPRQPIEVKGDVFYTSHFFSPRGAFRAQLNYPTTSGYLDLAVSRGMTVWQVDEISLTANPTPTPAPTATPVATPTPTAAPEQKRKRKR